ncbi:MULTISPECIES: hypothetical protein [Pseudomonas]|jgi:hypothetical protein|uniref:hypothetical protein n=1 Tax=Pseudomonas TaxID=286 RepID=UPI001AE29688|nr:MULTISPECIES: hypothetical protein [unclassified Pseudomonas]MBP1126238.1 hypothetical protein [Pseudomonas sp. PvP025]MDQ0400097.1 hypothetical protein [Pseudomonas sp. PvP006]MEB0109187.1 hypothetical protein [Pseudomonas sp. MH9.3]WPX77121.1 hypothetical protein RHM60_12630 [Pseudomonas sp. MH9.3]
MQESDLHTAIMRGMFELKSKGIDFGSASNMAFHLGNTMTSCPAVMVLPDSTGWNHGASYQLVRPIHSDSSAPGTTFDELWKCTQQHYGLTAATLITGAAGIPISKIAVGAWVHVGSSKTTNLASLIGMRFFPRTLIRQPTVARMAKATFGTVRVFGIIGRGIPFVAAGLAIFDLVSIGKCAYEARNGR